MQGFQGYGYDDEFVKNTRRIVEYLKIPCSDIEIVISLDDICNTCPNKDTKCKPGILTKPLRKEDKLVMEKLGLRKGQLVGAKDAFDLASETFKTKASLKEICGECSWQDKCTWYQSRED